MSGEDVENPLGCSEEEVSSEPTKPFIKSEGLTTQEAELLLQKYGRNELPENKIPLWYIFLQLLWQPMPIMIWLAALVELAIENYLDMAILLFIQFANASIAFYETTKAGDAVAALKASLKPEATVKRDGKMRTIDAGLLVPGDLVLLASGSAIPADCRVNHGTIDVDQAQLTGESLPVTMYEGSACMMGSTVVRGEVEGTVEFTGVDTFFGKTASLLKDDGEMSNLQAILVDIMIVLVCLSTLLCTIVFVYLIQIDSLTDSLSFTVVLMVASIPLAIEIVTTTTLALGSKELSKRGAIVTRLSAIEDMAGMAILCSDKTGTLTLNQMMIQEHTPTYTEGETQYSILRAAAMAAKWKEPPRDALDKLTLTAVDLPSLDIMEQIDFMPFDPIVKRTEGTVRNTETGEIYKTSKGAPNVICKLVDDPAVTALVDKDVQSLGQRGIRSLAVARTNAEGKWQMLGLLTFLDPPRPDTKQTIEDARFYGVQVKMITGDHLLIAKETARVLDLGLGIQPADGLPLLDPVTKKKPANLARDYGDLCLESDGFAQVFPEHKYLIVECLRELGHKVGMTGDGVNDAPALKRADVGVAVQGSTDAARAAAAIVLTEPGLSTIIDGIIISRCIFVRIRNFITYRISATLQLLVFFFVAVFLFSPSSYVDDDDEYPEYFHMPVLMLMLITLLNDGTLIAIGYDNVVPCKTPEKWNLRVLFFIGSVLGGVACISSLLLLWMLLDSNNSSSVMSGLGLGGISYGQVTTSIYLKVSISDFLTLFSSRTGDDWFWTSSPAPILFGAAMLALGSSTLLACVWPSSWPDGVFTIGLLRADPYALPLFIWAYCVLWWFVQDAAKVLAFKFLRAFNIFGINDSGVVSSLFADGNGSGSGSFGNSADVGDHSGYAASVAVRSGSVSSTDGAVAQIVVTSPEDEKERLLLDSTTGTRS